MATKSVLLVEDSPEVRRLAKAHLVRLGHEVLEASDGGAALAILAKRIPDLVCVDLTLPEVSGFELCEAIRATPAWSHLPILVISARSSPSDRAHALEAGANAVLLKPFRAAQLDQLVTSLLEPVAKPSAS